MGVLRREPGGRAPLLSILKDIYGKAMETGMSPQGLVGQPGGGWGSFAGDFERYYKRAT